MRLHVIAALFLISCSAITPYGPYGMKGGYRDKQLGEGRYRVEVHGNGHTSLDVVEGYARRRARELCPAGFKEDTYKRGCKEKVKALTLSNDCNAWIVTIEVSCSSATEK